MRLLVKGRGKLWQAGEVDIRCALGGVRDRPRLGRHAPRVARLSPHTDDRQYTSPSGVLPYLEYLSIRLCLLLIACIVKHDDGQQYYLCV